MNPIAINVKKGRGGEGEERRGEERQPRGDVETHVIDAMYIVFN